MCRPRFKSQPMIGSTDQFDMSALSSGEIRRPPRNMSSLSGRDNPRRSRTRQFFTNWPLSLSENLQKYRAIGDEGGEQDMFASQAQASGRIAWLQRASD